MNPLYQGSIKCVRSLGMIAQSGGWPLGYIPPEAGLCEVVEEPAPRSPMRYQVLDDGLLSGYTLRLAIGVRV